MELGGHNNDSHLNSDSIENSNDSDGGTVDTEDAIKAPPAGMTF